MALPLPLGTQETPEKFSQGGSDQSGGFPLLPICPHSALSMELPCPPVPARAQGVAPPTEEPLAYLLSGQLLVGL